VDVRRRIRLVAATVALATLVACSSGGGTTDRAAERAGERHRTARVPGPVQHLDIIATEYRFRIEPDPASGLRSGWTEVRFHNDGGEAHQVMFARLKDGVDLGALAAAGAGDSSGAAAIEFVDMIGGVSYIGPRQDISAMVRLPAGTVMAMCYVPDRHGVAHALMGMSTILTVTDAPGDTDRVRPGTAGRPVEGTITLSHRGYEMPRSLSAGWYHVTNTDLGAPGTGLHELAIMRLGHALDPAGIRRLLGDLAANATPKVALSALGGLGAISPGFDGYLYLDLPRGNYLAVDFMPDARNPRPHLLDGYATTFER
jgi:hypothetical protein